MDYYVNGSANTNLLNRSSTISFYYNLHTIYPLSDTSFLFNTKRTFDLHTEKNTHFEAKNLINEVITGYNKLTSLSVFIAYNSNNVYLYTTSLKKKNTYK